MTRPLAYTSLCEDRPFGYQDIDHLFWIKTDTGAWEGPLSDWQTSHKSKYQMYCRKFDVVVCAGGNQGMYPLLFSSMFKTVYTFEPDPLNFFCLTLNCQTDNVVKMQCALGSSHKMISVQRDPTMTNTGTHAVVQGGYIPQLMLDDLDLHDLDLLQLDVEGYEYEVLKGAIRTITMFKPLISVERTTPSIESILAPLGYNQVAVSFADTIYKAD